MTEPLLRIRGLDVGFGAAESALRGVDLEVAAGQTVALVGESGSGKSTTASAVLGLLPSDGRIRAGRIEFDGVDISGAGERALRKLRGDQIGFVPQDPAGNLNPVYRVGFQVAEALRVNGFGNRRRDRTKVAELLADVGMPEPVLQARRYPHQLSGGMQQRALIAIGLARRPRLLIADEPTSALDVTVQRQVLDHLQQLTAELSTAVLLITHDLALAAERADRVVVMRDGEVVEAGPARTLLRKPQHEYSKLLVASAPALTVRTAGTRARPEPVRDADDIVVVTDVTKRFGAHTAVDAASLRIPRGTTMGLVGESGSGKTTLGRMVLGLTQPTSGRIEFDGIDLAGLDRGAERVFRRRAQVVFQNPYRSLDPRYSVFDSVVEPLRIHRVGDRAQRRRAVVELLDQVALPRSVAERKPRELSGGQRQRVAIARALALRPELVTCDEAVSALDVVVQAQILDLLADLQARLGLTYLFISHDLAVVNEIADQVAVMQAGRIVECAATASVFDDPQHPYTRSLLDAIPGAGSRVGRREC